MYIIELVKFVFGWMCFQTFQVDINLLVASILDLNENVTMLFELKEY